MDKYQNINLTVVSVISISYSISYVYKKRRILLKNQLKAEKLDVFFVNNNRFVDKYQNINLTVLSVILISYIISYVYKKAVNFTKKSVKVREIRCIFVSNKDLSINIKMPT